MPEKELVGKVAVITGGSKGIGKQIAKRLYVEGCSCFLLARSDDLLAQAAAEISPENEGEIAWQAADLSTLEGCKKATDAALKKYGHVDILINCAGATKAGSFPEQTDEDWLDGFNLKFHGAVRLTRSLWPSLVAQKGTVINIGGAAVYSPSPGFMVGGAVNAALAHFSKSLSLQGLKDDVNVNIIHPGMTSSERMQTLLQTQADAEGISPEEVKKKNVAAAGIRRIGKTEDVAELTTFLCTPKARHIQGVGIPLDGGGTAGFH
jgi:3-oxoacyl-[acyl-carrier protein] reductase